MKKRFAIFLFTYCLSYLSMGQGLQDLPFSWDNASVYFVLTDRFENGDPSNDHSYNRGFDGNGNAYDFDEVGGFHGGDLRGLTNKIEEGYFDELGINAIWITAPYEQIHGWVAGKDGSFQHYSYHGYYTLDWTEMDANMGSREDFRNFVDAAHEHGIRIIVDIVMNHTGYNTAQDMDEYGFGCLDNAWKGWRPSGGQTWSNIHDFIEYDDCTSWINWWGSNWVRAGLPGYTPPGSDEKTMTLAGLPDVITESTANVALPPILNAKWSEVKKQEELAELDAFFTRTGYTRSPRNYIIKWLTDWVREFGIDGFRVDTEKHVEGEAWKTLKEEAVIALQEWKANNPDKKLDNLDFWMTAENYGYGYGRSDYHINHGYNSVINFNFQNQAGNLNQLEPLYSTYAQTINTDPKWNVLSYISSHDTRLYDRNKLIDAATSLMLLPGGIQIFYGDETARPFGPTATDPEQGTRSFMNWNSINQEVLHHWQKLGQFRRNHLSVGAGSHTKISDSPYTFMREYENDKVVVVIGANGYTLLHLSTVFPDGTELRDAYTGNLAVVSGGKVGFNAHKNGIILIEASSPLSASPVVSINPASGHSIEPITVEITATSEAQPVKIYYTTDGSTPNSTSQLYSEPFTLQDDATVKAIAVDAEGKVSTVKVRNYTIGELPNLVLHFKKPANWGAEAFIHHWNAKPAGGLKDSTWPGKAMVTEGNGWYSYTLVAVTHTNLLFHDNAGNKTIDMERSTEGWYMNGSWYNENPETPVNEVPVVNVNPAGPYTSVDPFFVHVSATDDSGLTPTLYYTLDGSIPDRSSESADGSLNLEVTESLTLKVFAVDHENLASEIETHEYTLGEEPGDALKVYFKKPADWGNNIMMHHWNAQPSGSMLDSYWPGVYMSDEGNGWYSFEFPQGVSSSNLLFHDNWGHQTPDLNRSEEGWYFNGSWYSEKPDNQNSAGLVVHFKTSWSSPSMHYWNVEPAGVAENTSWPGISMIAEGNGWWTYTIPNAACANVIFSNNGAPQTADLYRCREGWYMNGIWHDAHPSISAATIDPAFHSEFKGLKTPKLTLEQNHPNPVNGSTYISFSLPKASQASLKVYSILGEEVAVIAEGAFEAGSHQVRFESSNFPPGIYKYMLTAGGKTLYKRLIITK